MNPETPPITNSTTSAAKNLNAVVNTGLPVQIVATQANTDTAEGITITKLAAEKNPNATEGKPVANMWCTHTPKPSTIVRIVANTTADCATSGRRQYTGNACETMLIAGSTIAYTHGCPKIQNRCCHSNGCPPMLGSKKCVPKRRSHQSMKKSRLTAGTANSRPMLETSVPQIMIGTRLMVMPGARVRNAVARKLIAPAVVEMPRNTIPSE